MGRAALTPAPSTSSHPEPGSESPPAHRLGPDPQDPGVRPSVDMVPPGSPVIQGGCAPAVGVTADQVLQKPEAHPRDLFPFLLPGRSRNQTHTWDSGKPQAEEPLA